VPLSSEGSKPTRARRKEAAADSTALDMPPPPTAIDQLLKEETVKAGPERFSHYSEHMFYMSRAD
jgi:hypothetical protein